MQLTQELPTRRATPDDVLEMLRADYRLRAAVDPDVDDGEILDPATKVADWRMICDLVAVRRLAPLFKMVFDINLTARELVSVLEPEGKRTLGQLADWLAPRVNLPAVEPFSIAGTRDMGVGAFVALRSLLARAGVSVRDVRPSTALGALARNHLVALAEAAIKLAPRALPVPIIESHPADGAISFGALGGIVLLLLGPVTGLSLLTGLGSGLLVLSLAGMWYIARKPPRSVSFGPEIQTVGDLARAIALQNGRS